MPLLPKGGNIMKKIMALFLIILTIFAMTACMSDEEKAQIAKLEGEATEYMEDYFDEHYPSFKLDTVKQVVEGNYFEGYDIWEMTKVTAKDGNKTYIFYYDSEKDIVYSNVNYDKVLSSFEEMLKEDNLLAQSIDDSTKITCYDFEVLIDNHKTLEDVLKFAQSDRHTYSFVSSFRFKERKDFYPENLKVANLFDKIYNFDLTLCNVTDDYTEKTQYAFEYIDKIEYHDCIDYKTDERSVNTLHFHNDFYKIDDIICVYDARYVDFKIAKTENYRTESLIKYNTNYESMYRGYDYKVVLDKVNEMQYGNIPHEPFYTDGGCKVLVDDVDVHKVTLYFLAEKYENCALYRHSDDMVNEVMQFNKYEDYNIYAHKGYVEDTITFMKGTKTEK